MNYLIAIFCKLNNYINFHAHVQLFVGKTTIKVGPLYDLSRWTKLTPNSGTYLSYDNHYILLLYLKINYVSHTYYIGC